MKKRRFRGKPPEEDHREKSELFKREQRVRERVFYYDDDDDGDEGEEEADDAAQKRPADDAEEPEAPKKARHT